MPTRHTPLALDTDGAGLATVNRGRLTSFHPDVLGVKTEIERIWAGVLSVFWDYEDMKWVIVEHCTDGTDQIAFKTEALSQATIDRIHRSDQLSRSFVDPNKAYDAMDKQEERDKDHTLSEAIGEAAERLYFGLRKDGIIDRPTVYFS